VSDEALAVVQRFNSALAERGRGSGAPTRRRNATVNTVQNGLVTRIEYFTTEEEARAAAGLMAARER
jgi:hypothetical protein